MQKKSRIDKKKGKRVLHISAYLVLASVFVFEETTILFSTVHLQRSS